MEYHLTPYSEVRHPFAYWDNAFNDRELDWLQSRASESTFKAKLGGNVSNDSLRRSKVNWLPANSDTIWVFERLSHIVSSLNSECFRFNLTGFGEMIQLTNYNSEDFGMYGWHIDMTNTTTSPSRKLSLVLQLSDPSEYEGGNLELMPVSEEIIKIKKQRGLVVVFPSWTLHQVTPVTQGSRQSLVTWITGPAFK
jgi:PKHD-type hydroxylase